MKPLGTDLSLATCRTMVQQSSGHTDVRNEIGNGTTFKNYLPRVERPIDIAVKPIQTGSPLRWVKVLRFVEDVPSTPNNRLTDSRVGMKTTFLSAN
jgi:two-component system, cell cycle sensor histidine kinase and response regulator CckA